jgi:hypothetical protein
MMQEITCGRFGFPSHVSGFTNNELFSRNVNQLRIKIIKLRR